MSLTALPLGLAGRVFRSPMPFGPYDPQGAVYDQFRAAQISVIVLLTSDAECLQKTGRDLRTFYLEAGFQVLHLPIADFSVPNREALEQAVQQTLTYARAGHHIVIHCSAGIGRTGLFTAYLVKRGLGLSGSDALQWVRRFIPHAVETSAQQRLILHDDGPPGTQSQGREAPTGSTRLVDPGRGKMGKSRQTREPL